MMFSFNVALQILSFSALLNTAAASVFESLHEVPRGWKYSRAAEAGESIKLRLSLKQQNVDSFIDKLMEVSDPDHPQYVSKKLLKHTSTCKSPLFLSE